MGLAAFMVINICQQAGFSRDSTLRAMYLTVLMPSFFLLNPLYRDQLMIMLILMIVYSILYMWTYNSFISLIPFSFASICLAFLRIPFAVAPVAILVISIFIFAYKTEKIDVDFDGRDVYEFGGGRYVFFAVKLDDYRKFMTVRSPKWQTVTLPADKFRKCAVQMQELLF